MNNFQVTYLQSGFSGSNTYNTTAKDDQDAVRRLGQHLGHQRFSVMSVRVVAPAEHPVSRVVAVDGRLTGDGKLDWHGVTVQVEEFGIKDGVAVIIDADYTPVLRGFAEDVKGIVSAWNEVTGPVVIRWVSGGKLGVYFRYVPEAKKDRHGNTILAEVNGWTIVGGEFCYVLTKGARTEVYRGTLSGAELRAFHS